MGLWRIDSNDMKFAARWDELAKDVEAAFGELCAVVNRQHTVNEVFDMVRRCDAYIAVIFNEDRWSFVEGAWLSIAAVAERHDMEVEVCCKNSDARHVTRLILARRQHHEKCLVGFAMGVPIYTTPDGEFVRAIALAGPRDRTWITAWDTMRDPLDRVL